MSAKIFAYCERGLDPGLLAEPLNLVSNAAFFLAAWAGLAVWRAEPRAGWAELGLVVLVFLIGLGSSLFHAWATPLTALADVIPIGIFMLAYLGFALRRYLGLRWPSTALALVAFIAALIAAGSIRCGGARCLNGSLGYVPALAALALVGALLHRRGHAAARALLAAAALLAVSLAFRTIDRAVCPWTIVSGRALGTHALWHLLNGALLGVLVIAAVRHGRPRPLAFRR